MRTVSGGYLLSVRSGELDAEVFAEKIVGWLDWERVAMLPEHAKGLPKITKYDERYKPKRAYKSVEVEAMGRCRLCRRWCRTDSTL